MFANLSGKVWIAKMDIGKVWRVKMDIVSCAGRKHQNAV